MDGAHAHVHARTQREHTRGTLTPPRTHPQVKTAREEKLNVEGDQANAHLFAAVKVMLVEEIGGVGAELKDGKAGDVREVQKDCDIVHVLWHRRLQLLGERRILRAIKQLLRELDEGPSMAHLTVAPGAANKVVASLTAIAVKEGKQSNRDIFPSEMGNALRNGKRGGPVRARGDYHEQA